MLQSSISESFNYFKYTIYYIKKTFAEGGTNAVLQFKKDVIQINKKTGKISAPNSLKLKEVETEEIIPVE